VDLISQLRYAAQLQEQQEPEQPSGHPAEVEPDAELRAAFDLTGRVAVVTGAARGIGAQAAVTFAQAGATVLCADVDEDGLARTLERVNETGREGAAVPTDVRDKTAVERLAARAVDQHGRLDVWANVAGVLGHAAVVDTSEDELDRILAVNLKGVYWGCAAAARAMVAAGRGSIVNIASAGGDVPAPGLSVYAMTKAAVMMLTRTLATEVGPHGVRVNAVAPGFIDTPMVAVHYTNADGSIDEERRRAIFDARAAQSPLGITGEPTDITYCMLYLAADASRFMTGQVLRPNGGVVMP
jgi:3-oxoacyl-[acyl-carrier protein] reductase